MDTVLVGAGNVASCIGPALLAAGHRISCVYSRTAASASALAGRLGTDFVTDISALPEADACIVMLRDDALVQLAPQIAAVQPGALLLHTSGSVPMSVWTDAGAKRYGVLYPMQTFSKGKSLDWKAVPLFIEAGSEKDFEVLDELAKGLSDSVSALDSEGRCRLHLAAVIACNFSNHMFAVTDSLLSGMGVPFSVMEPLIREMTDKAFIMPPAKAQTGPAARGDHKIMDKHLEMLADYPEWQELYRLVSEDIEKFRTL